MIGEPMGSGYAKLVRVRDTVDFPEDPDSCAPRYLRGTVVEVIPIETGEAMLRLHVEGRDHHFLRAFREVIYAGE